MDFKKINEFLIDLKFNNTRQWYKDNEARYKAAKQEYSDFIDQLIVELKKFDKSINVDSAKECMFRIHRDVRFSKNKEPYKTNFGAFIAHGGRKSDFAGYYVHMEPDQSFVGGGIYMPQGPILAAIRAEIYENTPKFKEIINEKDFKKHFNEIIGEKLKTAPKGFPKDFQDMDLIRHKHYAIAHQVDESFWKSKDVLKKTVDIYKTQYKFNSFLNRVVEGIEKE